MKLSHCGRSKSGSLVRPRPFVHPRNRMQRSIMWCVRGERGRERGREQRMSNEREHHRPRPPKVEKPVHLHLPKGGEDDDDDDDNDGGGGGSKPQSFRPLPGLPAYCLPRSRRRSTRQSLSSSRRRETDRGQKRSVGRGRSVGWAGGRCAGEGEHGEAINSFAVRCEGQK